MSGFAGETHQAEDLHAWQVLRPLLAAGGYLPWSTWSMRPAALAAVCNEVVLGDRRRIVECGSGISSVVLARLLRERGGGSVVSVEHDERWATLIDDLLRRERLTDLARVVHAPLAGEPPWYAHEPLGSLPDDVDLLIVDGPPAAAPGEGLRREPALGFFESRLTGGATVILDDAERPGESEVLARWEAETPWSFDLDEAAGVAVGRRDG